MTAAEDGPPMTADGTGPPSAKKVRFSGIDITIRVKNAPTPDVTIRVKYTPTEGGTPVEKSYAMYSQNLARLSNYFVSAFSAEATGEITLEASPMVFEKALSFLEDPLAARAMKPKDAVEVVAFYEEYHFAGGLQLCDVVFSEYFLQHKVEESGPDGLPCEYTSPKDLDVFLQGVLAAKAHQLPNAAAAGWAHIQADFGHGGDGFGRLRWTESHLELLRPLLKEEQVALPEGITLDSPSFAMDFLTSRSKHFSAKKAKARAVRWRPPKRPSKGKKEVMTVKKGRGSPQQVVPDPFSEYAPQQFSTLAKESPPGKKSSEGDPTALGRKKRGRGKQGQFKEINLHVLTPE